MASMSFLSPAARALRESFAIGKWLTKRQQTVDQPPGRQQDLLLA